MASPSTDPPAAPDLLSVRTEPQPDRQLVVLRLTGEIDLSSIDQLRQHLTAQVCAPRRGVVIDLTHVSFLAACGLRALAEIAETAADERIGLWLVGGRRPVLRVLQVLAFDRLIPHLATVEQALAQVAAPAQGPDGADDRHPLRDS